MVDYMHQLNDDLTRARELVSAESLGRRLASEVRYFRNGMLKVTDRPSRSPWNCWLVP
jgi:hypothetical protein